MREIDLIVIHCSATPNNVPVSVETIRQWHLQRGFRGVGYHYVITLDGKVNETRGLDNIGAHAKGFNATSIGICMVGGTGGPDKQNPGAYTLNQWHALRNLVHELRQRFPKSRVCGHRDLSPDKNGNGIIEPVEWIKLCPCFSVLEWLGNDMLPASEHVLGEK